MPHRLFRLFPLRFRCFTHRIQNGLLHCQLVGSPLLPLLLWRPVQQIALRLVRQLGGAPAPLEKQPQAPSQLAKDHWRGCGGSQGLNSHTAPSARPKEKVQTFSLTVNLAIGANWNAAWHAFRSEAK